MTDERTTTDDEVVELTTVVNRWDRMLIVLACFLFFVSSVLSGVNVWQGTQRNARIDHIDKVVTEAKDAARDAEQIVSDAVAAQKTPEAKAQLRAFIAIIQQIASIKKTVEEIRVIEEGRR